jgi:hypothetical protein
VLHITKEAPNFRELFKGEVRRIPISRTPVNKVMKKAEASKPRPSTTPFLFPSYLPRAWDNSFEKSEWWCTIFHPSASRR